MLPPCWTGAGLDLASQQLADYRQWVIVSPRKLRGEMREIFRACCLSRVGLQWPMNDKRSLFHQPARVQDSQLEDAGAVERFLLPETKLQLSKNGR